MSVDVEVGVGDEAEVLVFLAVEVKCNSICSYEPWILAHRTWLVTICVYIIQSTSQMMKQGYIIMNAMDMFG